MGKTSRMDPIWTQLPSELYVHIIRFIPDAVVRRDLGLKPRKMEHIPKINFPRRMFKDIEHMVLDDAENAFNGITVHITAYVQQFYFEVFDGKQIRQTKMDYLTGNVQKRVFEQGTEEQLWDIVNDTHLN